MVPEEKSNNNVESDQTPTDLMCPTGYAKLTRLDGCCGVMLCTYLFNINLQNSTVEVDETIFVYSYTNIINRLIIGTTDRFDGGNRNGRDASTSSYPWSSMERFRENIFPRRVTITNERNYYIKFDLHIVNNKKKASMTFSVVLITFRHFNLCR